MTLENVSTDHLRQVLAEVDDGEATERLMAAITYKEIDEVTQKDAAELYGYSEGWASKWFNRLVVSQSGLEFRIEQELVVHGTLI